MKTTFCVTSVGEARDVTTQHGPTQVLNLEGTIPQSLDTCRLAFWGRNIQRHANLFAVGAVFEIDGFFEVKPPSDPKYPSDLRTKDCTFKLISGGADPAKRRRTETGVATDPELISTVKHIQGVVESIKLDLETLVARCPALGKPRNAPAESIPGTTFQIRDDLNASQIYS